MKILKSDFFDRSTQDVARDLLGKTLYHQIDDKIYKAIITETEAYHGEEDLACHCSKGKTQRTSVMFDIPGKIYVYLIYGMYEMLNFVTMHRDFPAAVLIRGVDNLQVSEKGKDFFPVPGLTNGPGKLTKRMEINRFYNNKKLGIETGLYVVDEGIVVPEDEIYTSTRIGIDYAGEWKNKPWRFYINKMK
jgi:DNA-3-methyladenine glycosylase